MSKASLKVLSQTCLQEQTQNVNGVNKHVRVVVKGQPSRVQVQLVGAESGVNFRSLVLEAVLLYDGPSSKPVDWIKVKPLEYSGQIDDRNPLLYTLELMIKVLSSQHEDSLFKVKIQAVNAQTRQPVPNLVAHTSEILVISKPEVLKPKAPKGQKRARPSNDDQMNQVTQLLARLERKMDDMATGRHHCTAVSNMNNASVEEAENIPPASRFEGAISTFISAFRALKAEERPEKTRRVVRGLKPEDSSTLSEAIKMLMGETSVGFEKLQHSDTHNNGNGNEFLHAEPRLTTPGAVFSQSDIEEPRNEETEISIGELDVDSCGEIDLFQNHESFPPLRATLGYDLFHELGVEHGIPAALSFEK